MSATEPDERLERAFARYERAVQQGERVELVSARMSLCLQLGLSGWEPPAEVRDQMWRDRRSLSALERAGEQNDLDRVLRSRSHRPADPPGAVTPPGGSR